MINDSALQLLRIIDNSLNLAKMERGSYQVELQEIDLVPLIKRIYTIYDNLINEKQISAKLLVHGNDAVQTDCQFFVQGDETLCFSMIDNLFLNALQASATAQAVTVSLYQDLAKVYIAIHNQGLIPSVIRERFFEKYVTSNKKGGTGLGTYSALLMARIQEGDIQVSSVHGEGTTLSIAFPIRNST